MEKIKDILNKSLTWAENNPQRIDKIIDWSDSKIRTKIWYSTSEIRKACDSYKRPLRIAVCGDNNGGKSTLVNALIRDNIAPTDFFEFTYCPMVFAYGETEKATLIFSSKSRLELEISNLESKIRQLQQAGEEKTLKRIEVKAPKKYLKKYELADVPGLGASEQNAKIAQAFTEEVDVVIFVLNASILGQADLEKEIIKLKERFHRFCLVINKIDQIGYENASEAVNYISEQFGNQLKVFPMAAIEISTNPIAEQWFTDLEKQFLDAIAAEQEKVKIINALEKTYRDLSTIDLFLQGTYHKAQRYFDLVQEAKTQLKNTQENILAAIDIYLQKDWVEHLGFQSDCAKLAKILVNFKFPSETALREEIEKFFDPQTINREARILLDFVDQFIRQKIERCKAEIDQLEKTFFLPFQIEQTALLIRQQLEANQSNSSGPSGNYTKNISLPEKDSSSFVEELLPVGTGLLTTGLVTAIVLAAEITFFPALVTGLNVAIPLTKFITNSKFIKNRLHQPQSLELEVIQRELEEIRLQLAKELVYKVFPKGADTAIKPKLSQEFDHWEQKMQESLWSTSQSHPTDLEDLANYIRQGEDIKQEILQELRKHLGKDVAGEDTSLGKLSAAAVKSRSLFREPITYSVSESSELLSDLKAVIELETIQLSFIDRYFGPEELVWLSKNAAGQAFLRGWVYDVEKDSQSRLDFIAALNREKQERNNAISIQIVKYQERDDTPLQGYLLVGTDWAIELSHSLSNLGQRSITLQSLNATRQAEVLSLIAEYSSFERLTASNIQSLTL